MITEHRLRVLRAAMESLTEGIDGVESVSAFSIGDSFYVAVNTETDEQLEALTASIGGSNPKQVHGLRDHWLRSEAMFGSQPVTLYGPIHSLAEAEVQS